MGYKVINYFEDLQDCRHPYKVGDSFPRLGKKVTEDRLQELSGNKNKRGIPLIALETPVEPTEVEDTPKKRGRKPKENNQ